MEIQRSSPGPSPKMKARRPHQQLANWSPFPKAIHERHSPLLGSPRRQRRSSLQDDGSPSTLSRTPSPSRRSRRSPSPVRRSSPATSKRRSPSPHRHNPRPLLLGSGRRSNRNSMTDAEQLVSALKLHSSQNTTAGRETSI
jgi:hypothetical protein